MPEQKSLSYDKKSLPSEQKSLYGDISINKTKTKINNNTKNNCSININKKNSFRKEEIWDKFILWSKNKLSDVSFKKLNETEIKIEEKNIYIRKNSLSKNIETIIRKFFVKNQKIKVQFVDEKEWKNDKNFIVLNEISTKSTTSTKTDLKIELKFKVSFRKKVDKLIDFLNYFQEDKKNIICILKGLKNIEISFENVSKKYKISNFLVTEYVF